MIKKIAYVTDSHLDEQFPKDYGIDARKNWNTVLQDIGQRKIDEIIFGGDIGSRESNEWFFSTLKNFRYTITPGNHDTFEEVAKYCNVGVDNDTNEIFHSRDDEFNRYIFLDTSTGNISQKQIDWVETQIQTKKNSIIFIHHPVLSVPSEMDVKYPLANRDKLVSILKKAKKPLAIFCGHYHFDDLLVADHITQIITPSACFQVEKIKGKIKVISDTFGYRIIKINGTDIQSELISFNT